MRIFPFLAATWLSLPVLASSGSGCQTACSNLQATFPSLTVMPNATNYEAETTLFWDKRSNMFPGCIFLPTKADEVSKAMEVLSASNCEFAIRGGGHMNFPGANNINDGVLIAPNGLRDLKVNNADSNIEVGPGNKWVDVYSALAPYGSYTIGGRLKSIGVPGLTLIGGVSYFLNKYGFAMDNVIRYNVVLGNGTQVEASKSANRDLFWALKGGANNFGIVTKFVFQTYHIPKVTSTFQIFEEAHVQDFIRAACDMALTDTGAVGAGAVINMSYNTTTKVVTPQVFGLQEGVQVPPSRFSSFTKIPAVVRQHNVTEPVVWHSQFDTPNQMFRIQFGHHTIRPDADQLFKIYKLWRGAIEDIAEVEGLLPTFVLNLVPAGAARVANRNGIGNTFGLAEEPTIWWQFATSWARQEDDLRMSAWTQSLLELAQRKTKAKGLATDFVYMGDAGEFQKPFEAYGYGNINKMRGIRDKYDHGKVFSRLNWGGFKLG